MNRALLIKAIRETWLATLLFSLGLFVFEAIVSAVLPGLLGEFQENLMRLPFFQNIIRALLGTDIGESLGTVAFVSIAWVHPVVLTLFLAHEIVHCTRLPVGEIDRGTIEVVLALPVSRWQAYRTESIVWVGAGLVLLAFALVGNLSGSANLPAHQRPDPGQLLIVVTNLFALYVAVGGLVYLISSLSDHRGRAIGAAFGIVVGSFFLNFLAQLWEPAQMLSFLSVLHHYRPLEALQTGAWPVGDIVILTSIGISLWVLGGVVFARRDIAVS